MSEEQTQNIPDPRSFEERVFARFDALDRRFDDMDKRFDGLEARVQRLEEQSERRAVETKPIGERALAEIVEIRQDIGEIKEVLKKLSKRIDVISADMVRLRADLSDHEDRLDKLEAEPTR